MAEKKQPTKSPQGQHGGSTPVLPRTCGQLPGTNTALKTTWPELVGLTAEEAEKKIKEEKPGALIQVVPPNSFVTMDFRHNRVRLYVDSAGKVERPPSIG